MGRYATLCVLSKMYRKLLFDNLSIVWNIKIILIFFFVRRIHRCCVQSLVQIGEMAWEVFEKVGLRHFADLQKRPKWVWPISQDSGMAHWYVNRL